MSSAIQKAKERAEKAKLASQAPPRHPQVGHHA